MKRIAMTAGVLGLAAAAWGSPVWTNIVNFPADLAATGDGWSAIRVEDPGFISYRCAAEDFVLERRTRLDRITFYTAYAREVPEIIAGDAYIFEARDDLPGALLHALPDRAIQHVNSGIVNGVFGTVWANTLDLGGIELDAGRYFIAMRTVQTMTTSEGRNAILTTRVRLGESEGAWNFGVLADGSVTQAWVPMSTFNLQTMNEWAFVLLGGSPCAADFNGDGQVDFFDYLDFVAAFAADDPSADFNGDGQVDFFDYLDFVAAFAEGCE